MYHVTLIAIAGTMLLAIWNLVHSSPRVLLLFLPPTATLIAGGALLVFGAFFALGAAVMVQNGAAMLGFMLKANLGLYLLTVRNREDEALMRRSFVMMAALSLTLIGIFYAQDAHISLVLMLCLLASGYFVMTTRSRFLDPEG